MSRSRILLKIAKTKLSDCKDIEKYTSVYQAAYNQICDLIIKNSELFIKEAGILLEAIILLNIGNEYTRIISTIELE